MNLREISILLSRKTYITILKLRDEFGQNRDCTHNEDLANMVDRPVMVDGMIEATKKSLKFPGLKFI
jgi:hypothetical protein